MRHKAQQCTPSHCFCINFISKLLPSFYVLELRMKAYSAVCFFLLRSSVMPVFGRSNSSKYLYVCVRALLLIGFQFMSPGCCNAFSYYSWLSSPLVAYYCSFSNVVFFMKLTTRCEFGQSHRTRITHYFHQSKEKDLLSNGAQIYLNRTACFRMNTEKLKI